MPVDFINTINKRRVWVCIGFLTLSLFIIGYAGIFSRPYADDYCYKLQIASRPFIEAQWDNFTIINQKFSRNISQGIIYWLGGMAIIPYLTAIMMIFWLIILFWTINQFLQIFHIKSSLKERLLTVQAIIWAVLVTAPNLWQSLYWTDGKTVYITPLILSTHMIGLIASYVKSKKNHLGLSLIIGVEALIAGGFSETYASFQIMLFCILAYALSISNFSNKRSLRMIIYTGLVSSTMTFAIMAYFGAGNLRLIIPQHKLYILLVSLAYSVYFFIFQVITYAPLHIGFMIFIAIGLKNHINKFSFLTKYSFKKTFFGMTLVTYLLIFAAVIPSFYATAWFPQSRRLIIPAGAITTYLFFLTLLLSINKKNADAVLNRMHAPHFASLKHLTLLAIFIGPILHSAYFSKTFKELNILADRWDKRKTQIISEKMKGNNNIITYSIEENLGVPYITNDPSQWENKCMADYFGVSAIKTK